MDRMPKYLPHRERVVRLDRHRGHALFEYVRQLADDGDDRAGSFLDALHAGAFDDPPSQSAVQSFVRPYTASTDSGLRLAVRPKTVGQPDEDTHI
jgi:hypothetical protein